MIQDYSVENILISLYSLTSSTEKVLDKLEEEDFLLFSEQYEQLVLHLEPHRSILVEEHRRIIKSVLDYQEKIAGRMIELKNEAADWLSQQGARQVQKNAYHRSYAMDSVFIDYRK